MNKTLRWKIITVLTVFVVFFAVGVYPILVQAYGLPGPGWLMSRQLRLGLDLKGGVHLVLQVHQDDALRISTEGTSEQLREALTTAGVSVGSILVTSPTSFRVEGVPQDRDAEFRNAAQEQAGTNFEMNPVAAGTYDFVMRPVVASTLRQDTMEQALDTIERRVNELGVAEPTIALHGADEDQILVQLPGLTDVTRAKNIIRSTAILELKIVEDGPAATREALLASRNGQVPPDMEVVTGAAAVGSGDAGTMYFLVRRVAAVTGQDLRNATTTMDEMGRPAVRFSLNPASGRRFGTITASNIGRPLAIILDERVQSYPTIEGRITDEGRITGTFTSQETADLALMLRSGALPASMSYLEERVVGPSLGADSIRSGVTASLAGLSLVILFMLFYYRLSGINAVVAMGFNLIILLGIMGYIGAAMTLPGIAGFILTMGMGVDSNVLIFERIKEELAAGRGVRQAINASFSRVFLTLLDTHVTSLIAAAFLFQFGTGPIRGFATTLSIGLLTNLFTSIFVSKTIFEIILSRRPAAPAAQTLSI